MKSSYRPGQTVFDSVDDFAAWDHCITRGMPVSMEPRNYNNGIRIMQSPGYVVILLEMAHEARVIPTTTECRRWLRTSKSGWVNRADTGKAIRWWWRLPTSTAWSARPAPGVPGSPGPLQPETPNMKITEWFTRVAADTIEFKMTIDGPSRARNWLLHHRVSDVPRQQVPDVRVLLPRGEHSGARLHRDVALRTRSPKREEVIAARNGSRFSAELWADVVSIVLSAFAG